VIRLNEGQPVNKAKLKATITRIHKFIGEQCFYIRDTPGTRWLDSLCLAFISKAVSVSNAVIVLVEADLGDEAFGLLRTLLEMVLNLRYIINARTPELRAKRFIEFQSKIKMEWKRRGIEHFQWTPKNARSGMPHYEKFVRLEKKYPRQSWYQTRKNKAGTRTLALEPDKVEKVVLKDNKGRVVLDKRGKPKLVPATWAFDYFWIYFWTSSFVHVNVDCLSKHAAVPYVPFTIYTQSGKPQLAGVTNLGDQALFSVAVYLRAILIFAYRGLNSSPPENLLHSLQRIVETAAGDEAVARAKS
jgi:Family of unknown function (DUF5677)